MRRINIIVLDSFGVGELPDAIDYNDVGSNTLENIYKNSGESAVYSTHQEIILELFKGWS